MSQIYTSSLAPSTINRPVIHADIVATFKTTVIVFVLFCAVVFILCISIINVFKLFSRDSKPFV